MNGVHDMGGMHGLGAIEYEKDEAVFHSPWEGRVYALSRAMRAWRRWTLDESRHAIERLSPAEYLRMSYYERWFAALVAQLLRHGLITANELEDRRADPTTPHAVPALTASMVEQAVSRGIPSAVDLAVAPRFRTGQSVRARNINPPGHTRLPRYARGKVGIVARDHGVYVLPDAVAHGLGERRQHVYAVRFTARELWGDAAAERDCVHVDLWDDYLEPA